MELNPDPHAPCPAPFNLARHVLAQAEVTPDKIALQVLRLSGAERWSYAALAAAVRGVGTGFLRAGFQPGQRVLLRLGNTVDFPLAFLGAIAVGLVPAPTSAQLTAGEITGMAAQIDPAAVIAAPGIALPDHAAPVIDAATLTDWRRLPPCDWAMAEPDRLAYLIFTSGTSGRPRAVMHAHRAVWARRMMWRDWYGLRVDDRLLHAGAFNWTYTLGTGLMDPWAAGATALIPDASVTPAQLGLLLKRFDATIFAAAPGVYRQMLRAGPPALPKLRHGLSAGEKMSDVTLDAWVATTGTPVFEALGMSEVSTYASGAPHRPAPPGAVGYPQTGRRIALLDAEGAAANPGQVAVHRSDPGLFLGYWGQPDETAAKFHGDWFLTGDLAAQSPDGALTYLGRQDDMLNAGGFRVSPLEIEQAFLAHPGISDCAAVEIARPGGVSLIGLAYVAKDDTLVKQELDAHAQGTLARYKQPRLYARLNALPRGANNKMNRRAIREGWPHDDET